ncbi:MAG: HAD-IA family hydrolase [Propionicimonas sp.]
MAVKALILDADGVVQHSSLRWLAGWVSMGGPGLFPALSRAERLTLDGSTEFEPLIARILAERGLDITVEDVLTYWCRTEPVPSMLRLVDRVRAAGVITAMGTNQNPARGRYMLENLPYAEHFDALFHSWQIGYAKPDPAFYTHIVEALGIEPEEAVFVDDMAQNVAGARAAGLRGVHFPLLDTIGHLRLRLRKLEVPGA